jgi:hypothetical protein
MPNLMKIHPVGAESFPEDRQTDRHEEANMSLFSNFENAPKSGTEFMAKQ